MRAGSTTRSSTYVNCVIGTCTQAMSAATAPSYEDTAAMDFVNYVQADAVKAALAGTPQARRCRCSSIAAPFNRAPRSRPGDVTVRDVAGLYIFDNTLLGVTVSPARRSRTTWSSPRATSSR